MPERSRRRVGKVEGQPARTREVKLGCVFTQTAYDQQGLAIRDPLRPPTPEPSRPPKSLVNASMRKLGNAAGAERKKKWLWAMEPSGSGTSLICIFPARDQIVDLFHARQHLWELAAPFTPTMPIRNRMLAPSAKLDERQNRETGHAICAPWNHHSPEAHRNDPHGGRYFERNAERMRYPEFRRQHLSSVRE